MRVGALLPLLVIGCAPELGVTNQPLLGGTPTDHEAVVALLLDGELFCSGTLVSERVVVTAAHCIASLTAEPAERITVFFGDRVDQEGITVAAAELLRHPDWRFDELSFDIAVIGLSEAAPVAPMKMSTVAVTQDDLLSQWQLYGFGAVDLDGNGSGIKRVGSAPVRDVGTYSMILDTEQVVGTCAGDSGGPTVRTIDGVAMVAGVHSRSTCRGYSLDERLDVHVDGFVRPFIDDYADDGGCTTAPTPSSLWLIAFALLGLHRRARARD